MNRLRRYIALACWLIATALGHQGATAMQVCMAPAPVAATGMSSEEPTVSHAFTQSSLGFRTPGEPPAATLSGTARSQRVGHLRPTRPHTTHYTGGSRSMGRLLPVAFHPQNICHLWHTRRCNTRRPATGSPCDYYVIALRHILR